MTRAKAAAAAPPEQTARPTAAGKTRGDGGGERQARRQQSRLMVAVREEADGRVVVGVAVEPPRAVGAPGHLEHAAKTERRRRHDQNRRRQGALRLSPKREHGAGNIAAGGITSPRPASHVALGVRLTGSQGAAMPTAV